MKNRLLKKAGMYLARALSFLSILIVPFFSQAQVSAYSFTQSLGTYQSISTTGTLLDSARFSTPATIANLDHGYYTVTIPFDFYFNGLLYNEIIPNTNGGATFVEYSPNISLIAINASYPGAMSVMGCDLWGLQSASGSITSGSNIITNVTSFYGLEIGAVLQGGTGFPNNATVTSYDPLAGTITMNYASSATHNLIAVRWAIGKMYTHTTGTIPNRRFIIEWKNFADKNTTAVNNSSHLNFQLVLEESTNRIEFIYGDYQSENTNNISNQIGLRGVNNTDFINRSGTTSWSFTTSGNAANNSVIRNNLVYPQTGTRFTWTPPGCFAPNNISFSGVTVESANVSWAHSVSSPSNYEYYLSTSNGAPSTATTATGVVADTTVSLNNLSNGTTYYFWVRASCNTNTKSGWSVVDSFKTDYLVNRPYYEPFAVFEQIPYGFNDQYENWTFGSDSNLVGNPGHFGAVSHGWILFPVGVLTTPNIADVLATDYLSIDYRYFQVLSPANPPIAGVGYLKIYISNDYGLTYTTLDSIPSMGVAAWQTKNYSLANYAGQTIRVKIESQSILTSFYAVGVDNITVNALPCDIPVVNLGIDTSICNGNTITLNPGATPNATYLWSTGDTTQTIVITQPNTYTVTVTDMTCSATDTIVVSPAIVPVATLGNDTAICDGDTLQLMANLNGTYIWSTGDTSLFITVDTGGTYTLELTDTMGCVSTDQINITINPLPSANSIIVSGTSPNYAFSVELPQNVIDYAWDFGDGTIEPVSPIPNHSYTVLPTTESYTVRLIITNDCGSDTLYTNVEVEGDGTSIGKINLNNNDFKIYPNPANSYIKVENKSTYQMKRIKVINLIGQTIKEMEVSRSVDLEISLEDLESGTYFLMFEFEEGSMIRRIQIIK